MSPSGIRRKMRSPWDPRWWSALIHLFIQHSLRTCACQAPVSTGTMNSHLLRKTDTSIEAVVLAGRIQSLEVEGGSLYKDWETTKVEAGITSLLCATETRVAGVSHKNHILGDRVGKAVGKNETHCSLLGGVRTSLLYVLLSGPDFWLLVSLLVDFSDILGGNCHIA